MARDCSPRISAKSVCGFRRKDLILRFWQVIPSTPQAVRRVIGRIMGVVRAMECALGELRDIELALQEALTNAIVHGSGGDPKKKIAVCCLCDEAKGILLVVRDYGPGFDPSRVPDPTKADNVFQTHGRGIFLMRRLMDEVRFEKGGRQVVMARASRLSR